MVIHDNGYHVQQMQHRVQLGSEAMRCLREERNNNNTKNKKNICEVCAEQYRAEQYREHTPLQLLFRV